MTALRKASVERPSKGLLQLAGEVLDHAGPGYLQFAITNICNADCGFCGFARSQMDGELRQSVTLEQVRDVIEISHDNHIGYLLFVGGEPMVHPDIVPMTRLAAEAGIRPMICTNGGLWTEENMKALVDAGLSSVIMSIDAHDIGRHESNRGLRGVCEKIRRANAFFASAGILTTASITASRLIADYDKLPAFLESLGFRSCTFSYPLTDLKSSYLSFSDGGLVDFNREELDGVFQQIKDLKSRSAFPIGNPTESLTEMQRHLRGERERFGCLGGHKYFYLDWHLNLYRCHYWEKPMCSIYDFDATKLIRDGCRRCMIDCYRAPSILQHLAVNASDAWHHLKRGHLVAAAQKIFDPRNLTSLKAVWDERGWITKV
jgi:MoaA/NifB/PqqE/SkfB family radical SAM enzyme